MSLTKTLLHSALEHNTLLNTSKWYLFTPTNHLLKLTLYVMIPVLYEAQKSSLVQLRLAGDLLLRRVWWVMTVLQNTVPDPEQITRPSSRAPRQRGHQNYNKHTWPHVTVNLQNKATNIMHVLRVLWWECSDCGFLQAYKCWMWRHEFLSNTKIYLQSASQKTTASIITIILNIWSTPFTESEIYSYIMSLK